MSKLFSIQEQLIGKGNQQKIKNTKVAVIGVGGLGCAVAQGLVQMGVGHITLIDNDTVSLSNLPRQVLFNRNDIGKPKVEVAKHVLIHSASHPKISTFKDTFTHKNGKNLLKNIDIVIDCTDNYAARYTISKISEKLNIPMVFGGVNKFEGQVGVFNYKGSKPFYECFPDFEALLQNETCDASGVLPFVVQIIGNFQIIEVFKIIIESKEVLNNQLQNFNFLTGKSRIIKLK